MKTKSSYLIAVILLSLSASNVLAVLRSPYPSKPSLPDDIIFIVEERHDVVRRAARSTQPTAGLSAGAQTKLSQKAQNEYVSH
jgi:hypothetical protein